MEKDLVKLWWMNSNPDIEIDESRMIVLQAIDKESNEINTVVGPFVVEFKTAADKNIILLSEDKVDELVRYLEDKVSGNIAFTPIAGMKLVETEDE